MKWMFGKCLKTGPHQEALTGPSKGCGRAASEPAWPLAHSAAVLWPPPRLVLRLPLIPAWELGAVGWSHDGEPGPRASSPTLLLAPPLHPHPLCGPLVHPKPFPTSEHVCSLCPPATTCQSPLTDFCRSQPNVTPWGLPWPPPHRRWALTLLGNTSRSLPSCSELPGFTSILATGTRAVRAGLPVPSPSWLQYLAPCLARWRCSKCSLMD